VSSTPNDPWQEPDSGAAPPPPPPPSGGGWQQTTGYPPPPPPDEGWQQGGYGNYPPPPPPDGGFGQPGYGYPPQGSGWSPSGGSNQSPFGYLAGWWYRVLATILDNILVGIVATIVLVIIGVKGRGINLGEAVVVLVYQIALLGTVRAQTVGNMAASTKVVDADGGGPIGYGRSTIRAVVLVVLYITIIGGLIDIFWPIWDKRNQTLHDKAANCLVIRLR
jgi:uncharacterized RDD family membrane protein YckC